MKRKNTFKIVIIALAICSMHNGIFAQENPAIPAKKAFMAELNFTPFGDDVIRFNQLQLKYRINDHLALRLGLAFDHSSNKLTADDYLPSEPRKTTGEESLTKFGILPGIEYHFLKNSKISPYLGVEFFCFNRSVESHYRDYEYAGNDTYTPVKTDIDGATRNIQMEYIPSIYSSPYGSYYGYDDVYSYYIYPERAYTSFGGNLLAGCDFYFMRNMYVGVEVGLGYNYLKNKKVTIDMSNLVDPTIFPSVTTSTFGFYYNSALRLGFWF
jgi:hypothetical protein